MIAYCSLLLPLHKPHVKPLRQKPGWQAMTKYLEALGWQFARTSAKALEY